jgi:hypothetical protein
MAQGSQINHERASLRFVLLQPSCLGIDASGGMHHPLMEQIQLCVAIALPLQELQFRNLTFKLPIAAGQDEGMLYGRSPAL